MVAIFTGLGAGFERGSGSTLGAMGVLGDALIGRGGEQVFLNVASGNLLISKRDEFLVGSGPDASVSRTYNSQGSFPDDNGDRWRQSTDRRLFLYGTANAAGSRVHRFSADGSEIVYDWNGSFYATTEGAGTHDKVTYAANVLTWTDGDSQITEKYEFVAGSAGEYRIASQSDTDGNRLTFSYAGDGKLSRVTTADGLGDRNYIQYSWSGNNITQIDTVWMDYPVNTIKTLTRTRYSYDGLNRLTTVTVDLSPEDRNITVGRTYVTTYTYDGSSNRIQSITQSDGSKVEFGYVGFVTGHWVVGEPDEVGQPGPPESLEEGTSAAPPPSGGSIVYRVTSIRQWIDAVTSRVTTIDYDTAPNTTVITDPSGAETRLTYDFSGRLLQIQQPALTGGAGQPVTKFEYNTSGDVIRVSRYRDLVQLSANNALSETRYDYDSNGNTKQVIDGLGNVVTRVFGERNELLSETSTITTGVTATTRYVYDLENHLRYAISPEGRVTEYRYRSDGAVEQTIEYPDHIYVYTPPAGPFVPVPPATVVNPSFEAPEAGNNVLYNPSVSGMSFTGWSGVVGPNSSYFYFPPSVDGDQVGFIQGGSGGESAISHSVTGLTAGATYDVKFRLAGSIFWMPVPITVKFNGQILGQFTPQSSSEFQEFTASFTASGASGTLTFSLPMSASEDMIGERATGIDYVRVVGPPGPPAGPSEAELNLWRDSLVDRSSTLITVNGYDGRGNLGVSTSYGAASTSGSPIFAEGHSRSTHVYDQAGQLLSRIVDGRIAETFTYDGLGRVVSSTDLNGARTNIVFDDAASRTIVSLANGYVKTSTYNRLGELVNAIDSGHLTAPPSPLMTVASTSFETPEAGNGHIQNAPADGMFFYGSSGIAGNGSTWNFAQAPDGDQVAYVQATPGPTGIFEYRLSGLAVGAQYTIRFAIAASASRGGASLSLSFAGQFIGTFTPSSTGFQEVTATFTASQSSGNLWFTGQGAPGSATAIDKVAVSLLSGGGEFYKYDKRGLLRVATDATGSNSYFIHDAVGRRVAEVNHLGELVEYVYDAVGRVVGTARYANVLTAAQLATLADAQAAIDLASFRPAAAAADLWAWQVFDREGRLLEAIAGDGSVTTFEYDKSNRLVKTVAFAAMLGAAAIAGFKTAPPAAPVLPASDPAKDSVARNFYDKDGLLTGVLDGEGYLSTTVYDKAGRKVEHIAFLQPSAVAYRAAGTLEQLLANQPSSSGDRRMRYVYDGQGLLRYQVNGLNELIGFDYDMANQLTSTVRYARTIPETSNFNYANIKKIVTDQGLANDSDTRRDWTIYDSSGRVAYMIDAAGGVVRRFYDNVGQVAKTVQYEAGRATAALPTLADMDAWAATQASNVNNRTTRHYHALTGDLRFTVDSEGFVSGKEYDAERRITRVVRWKSAIAVSDADTVSSVAGKVQNGAFIDGKNVYDPAGRLSETIDGEGVKRRLDYNATGTLKWETAAYGTADASRTAFVYDNNGRVIEQYGAHGTAEETATKFEYDGLGNLIKTTDGNGNVSTLAYDRLGRLVSQTDGEGNVTSFEHNAFGEKATVVDGRGHSTVYAYDKLGRVVSVTDAEGYVTATAYTRFGEIESVVRRATRTAPAGAPPSAPASSSGQQLVAVGPNILANASFDQSGAFTATPVGRSNTTLPGWVKSNSQTFEQVSAGKFGVSGTDGAYWLDLESVVRTGRSAVGSNLVSNGSFELSGAYTATATGRANSTLPGWNKSNPEAFEQVQSGQLGVAASDGTYWLDLDSVAQSGFEIYGSNLVANGSFELSGSWVETATGRSNANLPGWSKSNPETFEQVQSTQLGVEASDGLWWLDLDSVPQTGRMAVGSNLLVNGSFGQAGTYVDTATGRSHTAIPGWTKANPETFETVLSGQMGVTTLDGGYWLDLESIPYAGGPLPVGSNLIANGSFELSTSYATTASGRTATVIPGWSKTNPEAFDQVLAETTPIEATDGVYWLDLDSVPGSGGMAAGPNLIVNGSFEQSSATWAPNMNGRINSGNIPGWVKANAGEFEQINSGVMGVAASDGSFVLDMEGGGSASRMDISQTIGGLAAGKQLNLKFDFANVAGMVEVGGETESSGALQVYWNGALIGTVGELRSTMATRSFMVTSIAGNNVLRFKEIGVADGRGVFIDNVQLYENVPAPNGGNMNIYQTIPNLAAGQVMQLQFDYSSRTTSASGSFEVWWNNALVATVTDGGGGMKSKTLFVTAVGGGNTLRFKGIGTVDALGAALDNVRLFATQTPPNGGNMDISQTVSNLAAGQIMQLQFDHANRTSSASGSFELWWNGNLVETITSTGAAMQTKTYSLIAVAGNNTVRFKGLGTVDAAGASLDNVRLFHTQPVPTGGNMKISQVIPNLSAGQTLQLRFDHANRTTAASGSFEVLWNGAVVATINSTGTTMQTKSYFVTAVAGNNTLEFRGLGDIDAAGASIDNVRLFQARPVPTGGNMAISQVVPNLAAGQIMQLQFDHANRTTGASGGFQLLWNGAVIATIDSTSMTMQTETYLVTAIGGDNKLEFKALGTVDANGASIDNVRLFATEANVTGGNMAIAQDVANLNAGQILELKFSHANRTTRESGSFEVVWNGNVVATIDSSDPIMQTKAYFVTAIAGTNRLEFRGLGTLDGEGASLDNVSLRTTELRDVGLEVGDGTTDDEVTRFYYDRLGRTTLTRDAEDYLTETVYNRFGDATSVTRRANRTLSPEDEVPTVTGSGKDAETRFDYDRLGRLKSVTDAEGKSESYEMDAFGRRTAFVNKLGGRTTYEYDNRGLLLSETLPVTSLNGAGQAAPVVNRFEYDKRGNTLKSIEAFGLPEQRTNIFHYDKLNRLTKTEGMAVAVLDQNGHVAQGPVTPTRTLEYDDAGNVIATVDELGTRSLFYYDRANRKKAELNAAGLLTAFDYDRNGNIASTRSYATPVSRPPAAGGPAPTPPAGDFRETIYEYDKLNRLTKTRIPNVRTGAWNGTSYVLTTGEIASTLDYDAHGNVVRTTDANGGVVHTYYDRLGRAVAQVDQENYLTSWERDSEGNVLTERRAAQRATGTLTTQAAPIVAGHSDDRITTFSYDKNGRRRFENRANVLSYSVDAAGAVVENASTVSTIEYRYNGLGLVTHKVEATGDTIVYDYDLNGRLVTEIHEAYSDQNGVTVKPKITYAYNGLDQLIQTRQGGETAATSDRITVNQYVAGRLASTTDATGSTYSYAYDAAGNVLRESYSRQKINAATGVAASVEEAILYKRDLFGRTTSRTVAVKSGSEWARGDSQDIGYSIFGEVSQRGTNDRWQEQYAYDKAGRLIGSNSGDGVWRFFVQDRNGDQTLAIESEGMDLGGKSRDEVLAIATSGGSHDVGAAYVADINISFTVYDKRGMATETRLPHRELNSADPRVELILSRDFNAFGEVSAERDAKGALTNYVYNTMGRNISISRPIVASTNESGVDIEAQPVETLYFDLAGRLVGSRDPNGNPVTRHLLAGTGYGGTEALTVTEFHADGGKIQNRYDVFGDLRVTINEVERSVSMAYDARGRLIQLDKASGLVEHFVYDLLGQRIKHWNSVHLDGNAEITEYDMQGRIRSQREFGGDITSTDYAWSSTMVTEGMGTFGGWVETTTYANGLQKIEHSDVFGRVVHKKDLGGHLFDMKFDKAARLVEQRGAETLTYAYLNSGQLGAITTSRRNASSVMEMWEATYGYDRNGNKIREQLRQSGALLQDATAEYDSLNRLTLWTEAGTAKTPYSRVAYKYDANGNVRMIHADYAGLDGFGATTGLSSKEHWYRYDKMNRVVVSKGVFGANGIVGGPEGVEIGYDQAGQRVRTLRSEQRMGSVFAPHPWNITVIMPYTHEIVETYKYDAAGHLDQVHSAETRVVWENGFIPKAPMEPGTLKADYDYDALGRLKFQRDYKDGLGVVYEREVLEYNGRDQVFKERTVSKQQVPNAQGVNEWHTFTTDSKYYYGGETQTNQELITEGEIRPGALGAVVKAVHFNVRTPPTGAQQTNWSITDTSYAWWDGAVQSSVDHRGDVWDSSKNGSSVFSYNAWGQVEKVAITDGRPRDVTFLNNLTGEAIRRDESDRNFGAGDPHEIWHRFNGRQMGSVGNNGTLNIDYQSSINARTRYTGNSNGAFRLGDGNPTAHADFDQNYTAINSFSQGSAGGAYTVRTGDTLSSIAAQLWGDSSLWYKLAEANGLGAESGLADGQMLTIPVGVFKNHHNASTFMPYDASGVLGDLSPTAPRPQAPVQQKKNKCGVFGQILLVAVAVAVTFLTQGALAGPMTGLLNSTLAGNIAAGAIAGAAGSVASQAVGVLTGIQERFDWKGVALAGISGAVGGALGGWNAFGKTGLGKFTDLANQMTRAAASSAITQGIGVAAGLQSKFSWASIAAAGVSAGVSGALVRNFDIKNLKADDSLANLGRNALVSTAGMIAGAATRSLIDGSDFGDNVVGGLPGAIGGTIGNLIGHRIREWLDNPAAQSQQGQPGQQQRTAYPGGRPGATGPFVKAVQQQGKEKTTISIEGHKVGFDAENGIPPWEWDMPNPEGYPLYPDLNEALKARIDVFEGDRHAAIESIWDQHVRPITGEVLPCYPGSPAIPCASALEVESVTATALAGGAFVNYYNLFPIFDGKRIGPVGLVHENTSGGRRGTHNLNMTVRDSSGRLVYRQRLISGRMFPSERALGFPDSMYATHTEVRGLRFPLWAGDSVLFSGVYEPCERCGPLMTRTAAEKGVNITYRWREGGRTQTFTAGPVEGSPTQPPFWAGPRVYTPRQVNVSLGITGVGRGLGYSGMMIQGFEDSQRIGREMEISYQTGNVSNTAWEVGRTASGWGTGLAGAAVGAKGGAAFGAIFVPVAYVTVPVFTVIGGGFGFAVGYRSGTNAVDGVHDYVDPSRVQPAPSSGFNLAAPPIPSPHPTPTPTPNR